jgi:hypothetical protein
VTTDNTARALCVKRGKCERCTETAGLQWCHIKSRAYKVIRTDKRNSLCLCRECHAWQHAEPHEFGVWLDLHDKGPTGDPGRMEHLNARMLECEDKPTPPRRM